MHGYEGINVMIKSIDELKDLIRWVKQEGVSSFKVDGIEVHFTALAVLPKYLQNDIKDEPPQSEEELKKLEDELLFHSAR